jgi:hypothetical protein
MLKAAIVALVGLALFAWMVADSSSFQSCVQEKQHHTADHALTFIGSGVVAPYKICVGEFIKENRDELLAVFTIVLAFSTIFLWVATRDLANEAAKASKVELRAYVAINHPKFGKADPDTVSIGVENGGQTPAYRVSGWLNIHWIKGENSALPDDFKFPDKESADSFLIYKSVAVLHPRKEVTFTFPLDFTIIERVRKNEIVLYLYGHVDYADVFGRDHSTRFCYQYFPVAVGIGHSLVMYDEHNDAT